MHVDGVGIMEVHLDEAERVFRARLLPKGQALGTAGAQFTLVGSSFATVATPYASILTFTSTL